MRIVSLSTVYPNPLQKGLGLFVRTRLQRLGEIADLKVIVPIAVVNFRKQTGTVAITNRRQDESVEVLHPRWFHIPGSGALSALLLFVQLLWPVLRLRREFRFDLIDAHFGYPEGFVAALLSLICRAPFTITLRGSELLHVRYPLRRWFMSWAMRRAAIVITVSEELRQLAVRLGARHTEVIPNGLDSSVYRPLDRSAMRLKHEMAAETSVILTAGHLIELKGHHHAVSALGLLRRNGIKAELWIAGGPAGQGVPNYEPQIRRAIACLGLESTVRFIGQVSQETLAELMSAADVFCLASSREGWPNVVQEALGCGTPVVATRVGAIPDILTSKTLGLIVPPGDIDALARAFQKALTADWDHDAIASFARKRCWDQVAQEVLGCMRRIVPKPPSDQSSFVGLMARNKRL